VGLVLRFLGSFSPYYFHCYYRFDILLDANLKPWLLEINYTPSFSTPTPIDKRIKCGVVADALKLINISLKNKQNYLTNEKNKMQKRVYEGLVYKLSK